MTYGTPLIDRGTIHKYLVTLSDTTPAQTVVPVEYHLPVDIGEHVEGTLKIFNEYKKRWI